MHNVADVGWLVVGWCITAGEIELPIGTGVGVMQFCSVLDLPFL